MGSSPNMSIHIMNRKMPEMPKRPGSTKCIHDSKRKSRGITKVNVQIPSETFSIATNTETKLIAHTQLHNHLIAR